MRPDAVEVLFTGADRGVEGGVEQAYQRSVAVEVATSEGVLLAYELNGAPLPPQHGFPLRVVVPGWYGMTNVKWLSAITVIDSPFAGYQQTAAYRLRQGEDDPGEPLSRMVPRSLMVPPGIPDFFTRGRTLPVGECELTGRAWSGIAPIVAVEVSTDGGATWQLADLDGEPAAGRRLAGLALVLAGRGGDPRVVLPGLRRRWKRPAPSTRVEPRRLPQQRRPPGSRARHRPLTSTTRARRPERERLQVRWAGVCRSPLRSSSWPKVAAGR